MTSLMEEYFEDEHGGELDDYYKPEIGEYHASTTGSCLRRLYLDFVEQERPGEGAWPHFTLGNAMEDVWVDVLESKYGAKYVVNPIPINIEIDDFRIVGETDPVVMGDNGEIDTLWEVKSTKNLSYVEDSPKWPHVCQLHCYAYGLDLLNEPGARKIVYIDKTNLDTVVHDVSFEKGIWNHILDKLRTLDEALKEGEIPEVQQKKHRDHFCPHDDKPTCCKNAED